MRLPSGIRRLFRLEAWRDDVSGDVDEEIRFHVDRVVEELVASGLAPAEARRRALARFGNVEAYRRALQHIDRNTVTTRRRRETMGILWKNLIMAWRGIRRSPGFAFAVVTILALGMGANAVMFTVVDRLLLSPPAHVVEADDVRLLYLRRSYLRSGEVHTGRTLSYPDYEDFKSVSGFSSVAAYTDLSMTFGRGQGAQRIRVVMASGSLFPLLGVHPAAGRFYSEEEAAPGAPEVAVLSWEFWDRQFGRDPGVVGQSIDVGPSTWTVVGVAPPGFTGAELSPVDVWLPLERTQEIRTGDAEWRLHRNWWWVTTVARLAPGVAPEAAEAQATAVHMSERRELVEEGTYSRDARILASPIIAAQGPEPSAESRVARWLAGVSVIVLLIACFNVANLLLARGARTRREDAVRMALGISRGRLLGERLTESLVLAVLGAAAALAMAVVGGRAVQGLLLSDVAFGGGAVGGRLLAFIGAVTVLTALVAGIVPALRAGHGEVANTLRSGGTGAGRGRSGARVAFQVAQAALSVILLVTAGLFVRSLSQARDVDLGFDPRRVAVATLEWNETLPGAERARVYQEATERVARLPGVRTVGRTYVIAFRGSIAMGLPRVPGVDSVEVPSSGGPYVNKVSSGYFEAMGLEILRGRAFQPSDDAPGAPPVVVVSEAMARGYFPDGDPLGACMMMEEDDATCTTVVGVVENHRRQEIVESHHHWLYYVNEPHPSFTGPPQALMIGTSGQPRATLERVRAELAGVSGLIRFVTVQPLQDNVDPQIRSWRLGATLFTAFGVLALVVAAWGLYSVLAFDVSLRRRELGIRAALGAGVPRLVRLVFRQALALSAVGVALGVAVSVAGARLVEPLLFRVSAYDPAVYVGVAVVLLAVAAVAGALPAWRATRADPREALQTE